MATNPPSGDGHRNGMVRQRSQTYNSKTQQYVKRDTITGRFIDVKQDGTPFKGVRKVILATGHFVFAKCPVLFPLFSILCLEDDTGSCTSTMCQTSRGTWLPYLFLVRHTIRLSANTYCLIILFHTIPLLYSLAL